MSLFRTQHTHIKDGFYKLKLIQSCIQENPAFYGLCLFFLSFFFFSGVTVPIHEPNYLWQLSSAIGLILLFSGQRQSEPAFWATSTNVLKPELHLGVVTNQLPGSLRKHQTCIPSFQFLSIQINNANDAEAFCSASTFLPGSNKVTEITQCLSLHGLFRSFSILLLSFFKWATKKQF